MFNRIAPIALVFGLGVIALPAFAQSTCAPRDHIVTELEKSYGERNTGAGLKGSDAIYEIWTSADSGTWTILLTKADGISCVVAAGEHWLEMPVKIAKVGAPA